MTAPLPITPRGLSRDLAAIYVGISVDRFDSLVQSGQMPTPLQVAGTTVWDRHEVDIAFSAFRTSRTKAPTSAKDHPNGMRLLTAPDIATRWGCSPRHVRRLMTTGALLSVRLGSKLLRCDERVVEEFERKQAEEIRKAMEKPKPAPLKRLDLNELRPLRGPRKQPA